MTDEKRCGNCRFWESKFDKKPCSLCIRSNWIRPDKWEPKGGEDD